ncbi:MAG: HEAT repeat domain-containing protein [Planctomycetota bacterium]|nr:HEAT repeat domain-containing protein [Planctomycetota bacterium]
MFRFSIIILAAVLVSLMASPAFAENTDREEWLRQQKRIDRLLAQLESRDANSARMAMEQLVQIGEPAVNKLCTRLGSPSAQVRMFAVTALGDIGDTRAYSRIKSMLEVEKVALVIIAAAKALWRFGDNSGGKYVVPFIDDNKWELRRYAISTLGTIKYEPAKTALLARITYDSSKPEDQQDLERHPLVLCDLAMALKRLGDDAGLPILSKMSRHENPDVRLLAVKALTKFNDRLALLSIAVSCRDKDERVADLAYDYLYGMRKEVIPMLQKLYLDPDVQEDLRKVVGSVIRDLGGDLPDNEKEISEAKVEPGRKDADFDKAMEFLVTLRNPDTDEREKASKGLISMGEKAIPAILESLDDESVEVKTRLIGILAVIADARALPKLRELTKSPNVGVRCRANWALGEVPSRRNVETLINALEDENPTARLYAINSLHKLTGYKHGFEPRGEPEERAKAVARWRKWWDENRSDFKLK